ncbi:MAG: 3'-5' exonuclease [Candidatus Omnitrophota bacterium]
MNKDKFVFFDVETTGLFPDKGDRICEIAAIKVFNNKKIGSFETLINPQRAMPYYAYNVHKISDDMLDDAPAFSVVADSFVDFLENSILCAYNINFDLGFINACLRRCYRPALSLRTIDVLKMARDLLGLKRYKLFMVAEFLGISNPMCYHRAMADSFVVWEVFKRLIDAMKLKSVPDADFLVKRYGIN